VSKSKRKEHPGGRARPVADRAREASEELEPGAPSVNRLARPPRTDDQTIDPEGIDAAMTAGVTAAGESDRPAGTHVPPEYPVEEVAPEIDVDAVYRDPLLERAGQGELLGEPEAADDLADEAELSDDIALGDADALAEDDGATDSGEPGQDEEEDRTPTAQPKWRRTLRR
jgi:hypothetical protein